MKMFEPKWTPSPWRATDPEPHLFPSVILHERAGRRPASICINEGPSPEMLRRGGDYGGTTMETAQANAYLIAAAPDLYRACEGLLAALDRAMDYIGNGWQPQDIVLESREARDQAQLFMARARGEPAIFGERGPAAATESDGGF